MERLILVTGPPSAGKTTLAVSLSAALDFPLLSKDHFKERLAEHEDGAGSIEAERSRLLSDLAWEHLFEVAARSAEAVIEGNLPVELGSRVRALHPQPVEVFCRVSPEVLVARLSKRKGRHDVHDDAAILEDLRAGRVRGAEPLGLGTVIDVAAGQPVDVTELAGRLRSLLY